MTPSHWRNILHHDHEPSGRCWKSCTPTRMRDARRGWSPKGRFARQRNPPKVLIAGIFICLKVLFIVYI